MEQAANTQLATIENLKQQLTVSQQEAKRTKASLTLQLDHTTAIVMAIQQEAKRTTDQLLHKLTATEKELNTTKQQLATTCQNLTKAEKEHTILAASTDNALTEMENKFQAKITEILTSTDKRIAELETKLQQKTELIEEVMPDVWGKSMQYRASKLSSGTQVVPVVVKMTEFTKHRNVGWLSAPFYDNCYKEHKIQLKVYYSFAYLSVCLLADHMQAKQPANQFVVKLLNQKMIINIVQCRCLYKLRIVLVFLYFLK